MHLAVPGHVVVAAGDQAHHRGVRLDAGFGRPATDSAPAGSAMMPSFWYSSSMAVQTAPSSTVVIDTMSPRSGTAWHRVRVRRPRRTAAPSTNWSTWSRVTGPPAASAAIIDAAPAGSTPAPRCWSSARRGRW